MKELLKKSLNWCLNEGYLILGDKKRSGRDTHYIEMSALSFYYWYQEWKHKIR